LLRPFKKLFNQKEAQTQALHAWWAATGASSKISKSLTHGRGLTSPNNNLAARSTLAAIKEGSLGHSTTGDIVTVLVHSFNYLIN
jgi:hypothetical protein